MSFSPVDQAGMDALHMWNPDSPALCKPRAVKRITVQSLRGMCKEENKIQGDMQRPGCSLCRRTDTECVYPTNRKKHTRSRDQVQRRIDQASKISEPRSAAQSPADNPSHELNNSTQSAATVLLPTAQDPMARSPQEKENELLQSILINQDKVNDPIAHDIFWNVSFSPQESDYLLDLPLQGFQQDGSFDRQESWEADDIILGGMERTSFGTKTILESNGLDESNSLPSVMEVDQCLTKTTSSTDQEGLFSINMAPDIASHLALFRKSTPFSAPPSSSKDYGFSFSDLAE
ncbi:hypothetical protein BKA66DRAFT_293174 [Pyrenochaeta sp. MPI-SDFR-AT-0127]|nr:hypothetical protein BKA66DRAFT_293174 [Pyrenochaeta sp. MPI-SDFR-AT-0127]